jgi:quinone-modifying oxidoreductase, subunit QmoB
LCPYGAVNKGARIAVVADACAGCGICVAECPRGAIELGTILAATKKDHAAARPPDASPADPRVVVFCCARSAGRARALYEDHGQQTAVDAKVVTVPCAGAVSVQHLLSAFADGAAGVLVLTCHEGNCHSETGNQHARRRVDHLADLLGRMGFGGDRLAIATLAANMPVEYADVTRRFSEKIHKIAHQR